MKITFVQCHLDIGPVPISNLLVVKFLNSSNSITLGFSLLLYESDNTSHTIDLSVA